MFITDNNDAKIILRDSKGRSCPYLFADTHLAKRLSGLTQIMHDLAHAKELIELIESTENQNVSYSLWMSAVITYGKCFATAKGRRIKLEKLHVEKFDPEALDFHSAIIDLRNEYFAHAGNNDYEHYQVCIILAPSTDPPAVLGATHTSFKKNVALEDELNAFKALCDGLYHVAENIADEVHKLVISEHKDMPIDSLYKKVTDRKLLSFKK